MAFGKRFSIFNLETRVQSETCVRCKGTGRVRERGSTIVCKPCCGTGRIGASSERPPQGNFARGS
jgi:DnaJ-class molecular chaperone